MLAPFLACALALSAAAEPLYAPDNLMAWCIVPFDAKNRGPEERAAMLARLGFKKFAYDWRAEHLPTFERELIALKKHNVELSAIWFPGGLTKENRFLLDVLQKHNLKTQLWLMLVDFPAQDQAGKVAQAAAFVKPIAEEAAKRGHTVALYNHGGWGGEPENQVAILNALNLKNVGIVYNLHHGHDHLNRFAELLTKMKPHLLTLNLNGMVPGGDKKGQKIMPLGHGSEEPQLLQAIRDSGYRGPIGILGHTADDVEARLQDNLDGLNWLMAQTPDRPKPAPRTPTGMPYLLQRLDQGPLGFEVRALTTEFQARLNKLPSDQCEQVLRVYRVAANFEESKLAEQQPILGTWVQSPNRLTFQAKFPPQEGQTYRAYLDLTRLGGASLVRTEFTVPVVKRVPTAEVLQVFPTAKELPENTLRLYFEFSTAMSRGDVYKHIQLLDENDQPVKYPFLELDQELWSPDGTRFTLLFDPGRVKRGLVPREELGPPLEEGKKYTLQIAASWTDENGTPMKKPFRKSFQVTEPVERGLNLKTDFTPGQLPKVGTREAYTIRFGKRLLDSALAQRLIWVETAQGKRVAGTVTLGPNEQSWSFQPSEPWPAGDYQIQFDLALEDICGNRIGAAFEVDVFKPIEKKIVSKSTGWKFTLRSP